MPTETTDLQPTASLFRRLAAILYDSLLLLAILMIASAPIVLVAGGPITSGVTLFAYRLYLLGIVLAFFGWFWTHGGQTLGMRAWRLKLVATHGSPVGWGQSIWRLAAASVSIACFGLGFVWSAFDAEHLSWHDRLSRSKVVYLPKSNTRSA